ncbi:MAG: NIPSNAP family protein, partial [Pirellulales bacterium]|nr:NIPSNAP family protein [Pirellulales bacterium]
PSSNCNFCRRYSMLIAKLSFPRTVLLALAALTLLPTLGSAEVFELRTYTTHEGKLDDLHARFRDHTVALFKKHGIESVGYWVPVDGPKSKNTLIYVIRHQSRDAAKASWKAFISDPQWQKVYKASRAGGPILARAPESVYLDATDYSPSDVSPQQSDQAVYELRTYRTNAGKLAGLDARFRDHTIGIFKRHGMESVAYWHPADQPAAQDTLIYVLRHESREAAKQSWKAFGADPEWKKVAKESQRDGKFLRERPEAVYMKATDYSALK